MSATDVNTFLLAGGTPSAKFPTIGTLVKGTIVESEVTQQTDLEGTPKVWSDGKPMLQAVVTLQTAERDPDVDGDTGLRKLYVKGQMQAAVRDAIKQSGASGLEIGGTLAVKYTADKPAEKRGHNPAKQYVAQYAAPTSGTDATNDLLGGSSAPSSEQPAPSDLI